jgi:hypothetical protein
MQDREANYSRDTINIRDDRSSSTASISSKFSNSREVSNMQQGHHAATSGTVAATGLTTGTVEHWQQSGDSSKDNRNIADINSRRET